MHYFCALYYIFTAPDYRKSQILKSTYVRGQNQQFLSLNQHQERKLRIKIETYQDLCTNYHAPFESALNFHFPYMLH